MKLIIGPFRINFRLALFNLIFTFPISIYAINYQRNAFLLKMKKNKQELDESNETQQIINFSLSNLISMSTNKKQSLENKPNTLQIIFKGDPTQFTTINRFLKDSSFKITPITYFIIKNNQFIKKIAEQLSQTNQINILIDNDKNFEDIHNHIFALYDNKLIFQSSISQRPGAINAIPIKIQNALNKQFEQQFLERLKF